ncbi:hypothetical protein HON58_01160 [Candidatus Peregrinibacteria bacterium]|jgi:hypothetical protein|nr:hypothetical protein [Candidatus Peregrinibacteria bacterium]
MTKVDYNIQRQRQKMHKKAYAILLVVILGVMGFYSYQKWQAYSVMRQAVEANVSLVSELRNEVTEEKVQYEDVKDDAYALNEEIEEKLQYILPPGDDYTELTRQLDAIEEELASVNDPFEVSNLDYQSVQVTPEFSVLPVRMNIRSSAENFQEFLHIVETSGSLDDRLRLFDISSIRLNFEGTDQGVGPEIISFTVQLNAYFQTK